jgi:DNA recombination protein RmuC
MILALTLTLALVISGLLAMWFVREKRVIAELRAKLEDRFEDHFKNLAATALETNSKTFVDLAKNLMERESMSNRADLEKRQTAFEQVLKPLEQTLTRYELQVRELERERQKTFLTIEAQIKQVVESNTLLSTTTFALKEALRKPHVRGRWGEIQLRNCVELAGMSEHCDVEFQAQTLNDDGERAIPDMTVRMPGGRLIVVDCKTPLDAFLASLEATTEELRAAELLRHGRHVKDHVKRLSTRAYLESFKDSPDFTVMFLPNESFLYAALESEPDLIEYGLQKKVLITTPPTLIGLLKVIRFGWTEEKLTQNAQRISEAGQELHKRLVDFVDSFLSIGKHIEKAKAEFDVGLSRLERRVLVQARRMETLGVKSSKSLPDRLGVIENVNEDPPPEAPTTT